MTKRPSKRQGRPVQIPIHGDGQHNAAIQILIGGLVVPWANNESVFLAILQCLVGGDEHTAAIIWHHQRTTVGRLDLVLKLAREQVKDAALIEDLSKLMERFRTLSKWRNFYCHATYIHNSERQIESAHGITLAQEGDPIRFEDKPFNRGTVNEITQAIMGLNKLNREIWLVVNRIETALKVRRVKRPRLLEELMAQESHPPKDEPPEP